MSSSNQITEPEKNIEEAEVETDKAVAQTEKAPEQQRVYTTQELLQPTSLEEYIAACHEHLSSKFQVRTCEGTSIPLPSTNNPHINWCPTRLKPWSDFLRHQSLTLGKLYATFSNDRPVFESRKVLADMGERLKYQSIKDARTLEYFLYGSVEDPLKTIINELIKSDEFRNSFDIGSGIIFDRRPNDLSDVSSAPRNVDYNQRVLSQTRVYRSADESREREIIYISEYKPPHLLATPLLRKGLREMNIYDEVVNRDPVTPADPEALFQYHAERLTTSALTQTYHHMVTGGLEYGLLTTGEAIVFLKVDWEEPDTLYYHLAEPKSEVTAHPDNIMSCAAVGQHLAFILLASSSLDRQRQRGQDEIAQAVRTLREYPGNFADIQRSIPKKAKEPQETSASNTPTTYSTIDRSPVILPKIHEPVEDASQQDSSSSSNESVHNLSPRCETPHQTRDYCTQKCLLGLVDGGLLDPDCPNFTFHRNNNYTSIDDTDLHHPVDHGEWLWMLYIQLGKSLEQGVVKLGVQGAHGVLFQVTMLAYGYTFVCKGTVRTFVPNLLHEVEVYERLKPAQGTSVPVFLGDVDLPTTLRRTYYYDFRVQIVHMMFLSWGGENLCNVVNMDHDDDYKEALNAEISRALQAIHDQGVMHLGIQPENILLRNPETREVMLIDFGESRMLEKRRLLIVPQVPSKRKSNGEIIRAKPNPKPPNGFARDREMAKDIFPSPYIKDAWLEMY
ncbi:hypothetical protein F4825DRAFT_474969 [Nemania diffusa]|nr:hypothetical protein F4825DRAFT_474969 [Nemania diffusa]